MTIYFWEVPYKFASATAAVKVWQQAVQAFQSQGDSLNQAMVLSNLALAYQALGQLPEAKNAIATSLQLLQSQPDTREKRRILAQALNTQGSLQMALLDTLRISGQLALTQRGWRGNSGLIVGKKAPNPGASAVIRPSVKKCLRTFRRII